MGDLKCHRCGVEKTHADAQIADLNKTCEGTREYGGVEVTVPVAHNWFEMEREMKVEATQH